MLVAKLCGDVFQYIVNENNFVFFDNLEVRGHILVLKRQGAEIMSVYSPDKEEFLMQWEALNSELP